MALKTNLSLYFSSDDAWKILRKSHKTQVDIDYEGGKITLIDFHYINKKTTKKINWRNNDKSQKKYEHDTIQNNEWH